MSKTSKSNKNHNIRIAISRVNTSKITKSFSFKSVSNLFCRYATYSYSYSPQEGTLARGTVRTGPGPAGPGLTPLARSPAPEKADSWKMDVQGRHLPKLSFLILLRSLQEMLESQIQSAKKRACLKKCSSDSKAQFWEKFVLGV